jgi:hypothetical protein
MESQNGHRSVPDPSSGSATATPDPGAPSVSDPNSPASSQFGRAAHSALLVFVAGLGFFAFVIGSGLFGTIGQVVISLTFFGTALSYVWWVRLDQTQRDHVVREVREYVRRKPSHS